MRRTTRYIILTSLLVQMFLLGTLGYRQRYFCSADGYSYIRIAQYYAIGRFDLAVSGYWGPMLSWLIAPLLHFIPNPIFAGRVVMGFSAIIFTVGCLAVWYRMDIPPLGLMIGSWLVALASACWSVRNIGPDLLVGGLMLLGISGLMAPGWVRNISTPVSAGLILGLAYLAKSVALPLAFLFVVGIALLWWASRLADARILLRASLLTLASCALVASPWVVTLSKKYGKPVFSTSAAISHALISPERTDWGVPGFGWGHPGWFGKPESGRLAVSEDPPVSNYRSWSPLSSQRNLTHQVRIAKMNFNIILSCFIGFDILGLGCSALLLGLIVHTPWAENMKAMRWRWSGVPVLCIGLIYLPVYAAAGSRYFYPAHPFLFAAAIGLVYALTARASHSGSLTRNLGLAIVTFSFLGAIRYDLREARQLHTRENAEPWEYVAQALKEGDVVGPIITDRHALDYALGLCQFTQRPLYGLFHQGANPIQDSMAPPTLDDFIDVGAGLVIVERDSQYDQQLTGDGRFKDIERLLPEDPRRPRDYRLYRILRPHQKENASPGRPGHE